MQLINFQVKTFEDITDIPEVEITFKAVFTNDFSKHISDLNIINLKNDIAQSIKDNIKLTDIKEIK